MLEIYEDVLPVGRRKLEMKGGVVAAGMESLRAMAIVENFEVGKAGWWVDMVTLGVLARAVDALETEPVKAMKWLLRDAKIQLGRTEKVWGMVLEGKSICGLGVSRRKKLLEKQVRTLEMELMKINPGRGSWSAWLQDLIEDGQRRHWKLESQGVD